MSNPILRAARHFITPPVGYGVASGDVHPSEQERLNNLVPQWGSNFRPSVLPSKTLHTQPFRHQSGSSNSLLGSRFRAVNIYINQGGLYPLFPKYFLTFWNLRKLLTMTFTTFLWWKRVFNVLDHPADPCIVFFLSEIIL